MRLYLSDNVLLESFSGISTLILFHFIIPNIYL
jgi:hypothetical protein